MSIESLVREIRQSGVELWLDAGNLKLRGPKAALTTDLVDRLRSSKPLVIDWLRENADSDQPLSSAQASLWTLYQLHPQGADYNIAYAIQLHSAVDPEALGRAFAKLVERHDVLRMRFANSEKGPRQQQIVALSVKPVCVDTSDAGLAAALQASIDQPYALEQGPPIRLHLLRSEGEDRLLVLGVHHIVADFLSMEILLDELAALYLSARDGGEARLQRPARTYADCIEEEQRYLASERAERDWQYWQQQLQGELPLLDLLPHRHRTSANDRRGDTLRLQWDADLTTAIRTAAAAQGVSVYSFLMAIYYVLLAKCSGQNDLVVGMPSTDRSENAAGNVVGHFINSLPIRLEYDGATCLDVWLKKVQAAVLGGIEHREFPFPNLVQRLAPERDPDHFPVFQTLFNWNQARRPQNGLDVLRGTDVFGAIELATSNGVNGATCDLALTIADQGSELGCTWNFVSWLYPRSFVSRIADAYRCLVEQAIAAPQRRLDQFRLLSTGVDQASFRLVAEHPDAPAPEYLMHQRFVEQAARTPDAIAVIDGDRQLSYATLDAQSARIARHLVARGAGPEQRIGLLLPRSAETIAAILGVLRSGAAYVPLDPKYPLTRLNQIVDSARPLLVIDSADVADLPLACTDRCNLGELLACEPAMAESIAIDPALTPAHLAYLIYTSGSTGTPKGAALLHGNAAALIEWALQEFNPQQRAGVLGSTSISFDLSVMEIFCALSGGTTLILVDHLFELPTGPLLDAITMIVSIPTLIDALARQRPLPPNTRSIVLAGEATSRRVADALYAALPDADVHNLYGPTEDTTYDAGAIVPKTGTARPSLGRPQPFRHAYVFDAGMNPLPADVCGEIYLGGAGLARGYYGRPDLTAERFLPDPYATIPGSRIYRSGDLGMISADGDFHCLGRLDRQVKVRGFRIELEEIERAIAGLADVVEAHVGISPGRDGTPRIVAYIVTSASKQSVEYFEQELGQRLPHYMLPARYVWLPVLPRLPNRKLDRRALPDPDQHGTEAHSAVDHDGTAATRPALSAIEQLVTGAWCDVLGIEAVAAHSHFFRLGGHSLLAAQVVARVNRALGTALAANSVLEAPVFGDFMQHVSAAQADSLQRAARGLSDAALVHHEATPTTVSYAQRRMWLLDSLATSERYAYNIPIVLKLEGPLDCERLCRSIDRHIQRHPSLRTRFVQRDGALHAEVLALPEVTLEVEYAGDDWQTIIAASARQPFDLARGPLFALRLLRTGENQHVLLLNIHHIVFDGYSTGILIDELVSAYSDDASASPRAAALSYADYAEWQQRWLDESRLDAQLAYWTRALDGAPTLLELPADHARPKRSSHRGDIVACTLPAALAERLRKLARQSDSTLFMLLYAAFTLLLSRYARQQDLIVGTPFNNRNHVLLNDVVGMFVNTLPVRTTVVPETRFADHLASVRRTLLDAYAHADLPFDRLVEVLQPERVASHNPLVQITFALEHIERLSFRGGDLDWTMVDLPQQAAKFDLSLQMRECAGELSAHFTYNTDLYTPERIAAMARHWQQLLEAIVAEPRARMHSLQFVGAAERAWLLDQVNDSALAHDVQTSVAQRILAIAAARPNAIALSDSAGDCSYAELVADATRVAGALRAAGVASEDRIAVCMSMRRDAVVAMLGVMLAGAAYVPIDRSTPAQRVAAVCADAAARLAICDELSHGLIPAGVARASVAELVARNASPTVIGVHPEQLAYVIFTSGSSGLPKGVAISHAALLNLVHWHVQRYAVDAQSRTTQIAGFGFDAAVWEIWPTLTAGGCLLIAHEDTRLDPRRLLNWLTSERADIAFLPTPLAESLLRLDESASLPLRALLTGGDRLTVAAPAESRFSLVNHYGPTENAVVATAHSVASGESMPAIGAPIGNVRAYVLDAALNPVPAGLIGELYLAGDSLARGYVGRAGWTAERFLPAPFSDTPGARMYRTGDLVTRDPAGQLHFRGRADGQIKLRGYRIELDEIRIALEACAEVSAAAVRLHAPETGAAYIAAWIVASVGSEMRGLAARLRSQLAERLPDYMLPFALTPLERLPLTANGKVDYRALPAPQPIDGGVPRTIAPRTPQEELLVGLWESLIGYSPIGVTDNFFDVGGHSLLAMQIATRIQEATGRECTVRTLLDHPTVAQLATVLARASELSGDALPVLVARPDERFEPFPLTAIQQTYLVGRQGIYELGDIATQAYSEVDVHALEPERVNLAWRKLIDRHEMLRMVLTDDLQQRILPEVPLYQVQIEDLASGSAEAEQQRLLEIRREMSESVRSGHQWPLFENRITRLGNGRWRMHTTIDALIADGWSTQLLMREFLDCYFDHEEALAPLSVSYRDYVLTEEKIRDTSAYTRSRDYWTARVDTLPGPPELPLRQTRLEQARGRFKRRSAQLPAPQWQALQQGARALGLTPTNLLLATYARTLAAWSASPRFTLNLTLFNRLPLHPQVNGLVGDFTSLTLLEVDATAPDFAHFAQRLQQQLWADLDHKHYSGVDMLRELARARADGKRAVMPVVFTSSLAHSAAGEHGSNLQERLQSFVAGDEFGSSQTSQVWIDHVVMEVDGQLLLTWEAVDDLFEAGVLDAMFSSYVEALQHLAQQDLMKLHRSSARVPAVQAERRALMNATGTAISDQSLHQLVRAQARRTPDRIAVIADDIQISYRQLWNAVSTLAASLRRQAVQPNQLVAVCMHKGWEQIVACLAIQQAGAAYLPLDAALPPARRTQLLASGEVAIVLTQADVRPDSGDGRAWVVVEQVLLTQAEAVELDDIQGINDLAYVIFTSGSTGMPKGVMIDHRGAVNTILDINRRWNIGADDRVLALSALSFDLSVYDIFGLLAVGGAIVLPGRDQVRDPEAWARLMASHQVTVFNAVPALMQLLVDTDSNRMLAPSLRLVMMSGDWIPVELPARIRRAAPHQAIEIIGLGGATEASIWSNYHTIKSVDPEWKSIPYGRPLANQWFHVLDGDLQPCPDWVPGDLYIGGIGLAQGYWRDPAKTAASFIRHPHSGERLYRTGDMGRYRGDGEIEFLGRRDSQVKIQGYRVELGEIESVLDQHDEVAHSTAHVVLQRNGSSSLVGYVVPASTAAEGGSSGTLSDPAERLAFTLSARSLRDDLARATRVLLRQPEAVFAGGGQAPEAMRTGGEQAALGCWLGALARLPVTGAALGKHYYPSAGSLYPVQVYLAIGQARPGIAAGAYYYHPLEHALCRLGDVPADLPLTLALVGEHAAITPLYGAEAAPFCALEAGYMQQLLEGNGRAYGWRRSGLTLDEQAPSWLPLSPTQHCLAVTRWTYNDDGEHAGAGQVIPLLARQSYRAFQGAAEQLEHLPALLARVDGPAQLLVYRKNGHGGTLSRLHAGKLADIVTVDAASAPVLHGLNRGIFAGASFALMLTSDAEADALELHNAGRTGQLLMTESPAFGLGLCAVGSIDSGALFAAAGLPASTRVVHAFIGGAISAQQSSQWAPYNAGSALDDLPARLRQYLAERLPSYMVPAQILLLDAIPLSSNGKVDRRALPVPEAAAQQQRAHQPPTSELELKLAALWCQLLGLDQVGINDNFFEIGGNSMLLIQAHRRLQETLGRTIAIVDLFRHSDIAGLARHLQGAAVQSPLDSATGLEPARSQAQRQRAALQQQRGRARPKPAPHTE